MILFPLTFFNTFPGNLDEPILPLGIKDSYSKGGNYKFLQGKHGLIPEKIVKDNLLDIEYPK